MLAAREASGAQRGMSPHEKFTSERVFESLTTANT